MSDDRLKRKLEETAALQVARRDRGGVHDRMGLSTRGTSDRFVEAQMVEQPVPTAPPGPADQDIIVQPTTPPNVGGAMAPPEEPTVPEEPEGDEEQEVDVDEEMKRSLFNTLSELIDLGRIGRNEQEIRQYVDEHEDEIGELIDVLDDVVDMLIGEGEIVREPKTFDVGDDEQPPTSQGGFDEIKRTSGQQVPQGGTTTTIIASDQTPPAGDALHESIVTGIVGGADIDATLERVADGIVEDQTEYGFDSPEDLKRALDVLDGLGVTTSNVMKSGPTTITVVSDERSSGDVAKQLAAIRDAGIRMHEPVAAEGAATPATLVAGPNVGQSSTVRSESVHEGLFSDWYSVTKDDKGQPKAVGHGVDKKAAQGAVDQANAGNPNAGARLVRASSPQDAVAKFGSRSARPAPAPGRAGRLAKGAARAIAAPLAMPAKAAVRGVKNILGVGGKKAAEPAGPDDVSTHGEEKLVPGKAMRSQVAGRSEDVEEALQSWTRPGMDVRAAMGESTITEQDLRDLGLLEEMNVARTGMAVEVVFGDKAQAAASKGALLQYKGIDTVKEAGNGTLVVFTTDTDAEEARNRVTTILQNARVPLEDYRFTRWKAVLEANPGGQSAVGRPVPPISRAYNGPDEMPAPMPTGGGGKGASEDADDGAEGDELVLDDRGWGPGQCPECGEELDRVIAMGGGKFLSPCCRADLGEIPDDHFIEPLMSFHKGRYHDEDDEGLDEQMIGPDFGRCPRCGKQLNARDIKDKKCGSCWKEIPDAEDRKRKAGVAEQAGAQDPDTKKKYMQPFYAPDDEGLGEPEDEPVSLDDVTRGGEPGEEGPGAPEEPAGGDIWRMDVPEDPAELERLTGALNRAQEAGVVASWTEIGAPEGDEALADLDADLDALAGEGGEPVNEPVPTSPPGEGAPVGSSRFVTTDELRRFGEAAGDEDEYDMDGELNAGPPKPAPGEVEPVGEPVDELPPEEEEHYIAVEFSPETEQEERERFPDWIADDTADPDTGEGGVMVGGWRPDEGGDEIPDETLGEIPEVSPEDSEEFSGEFSDEFNPTPRQDVLADEVLVPEERILGEDVQHLRNIYIAARVADERGDAGARRRFAEALSRHGADRGLDRAAMARVLREDVSAVEAFYDPDEQRLARHQLKHEFGKAEKGAKKPKIPWAQPPAEKPPENLFGEPGTKAEIPWGEAKPDLPADLQKMYDEFVAARTAGDAKLADSIKGKLEFEAGVRGIDLGGMLEEAKDDGGDTDTCSWCGNRTGKKGKRIEPGNPHFVCPECDKQHNVTGKYSRNKKR